MVRDSTAGKGVAHCRTVHPTESLTRDHLKVYALISILGIYHVRKLYSVELSKVPQLGCTFVVERH